MVALKGAAPGRRAVLDGLRVRIRGLEQPHRQVKDCLPFGLISIDRHLPDGGLSRGALHEVEGIGSEADGTSATLFIAGILARASGPVLWCLRRGDLFAPALAGAGLHPDRVIYVETGSAQGVLIAMEEGLRHGGLGGVVGEVERLSMLASRRLQLAAEASGIPAFALRRFARSGAKRETTAAVTRWHVTSLPSTPLHVPGIGRGRWQLDLVRCRNGETASWIVEASDAKGRLAEVRSNLSADMADGSAAAA